MREARAAMFSCGFHFGCRFGRLPLLFPRADSLGRHEFAVASRDVAESIVRKLFHTQPRPMLTTPLCPAQDSGSSAGVAVAQLRRVRLAVHLPAA